MSLHFISGKPGGGKSFYALKLLVEELRLTNRNISTNLPLKLEQLAEYLHEKYDSTFNMSTRIRILTEQEMGSFWLHPAKGVDITERRSVTIRERTSSVPNFEVRNATGGTFYILDEIHLQFNARNWQNTGEDCIYYLSQHRKLGDDVIAVTQHVGNVDKQFRSMTQDYTFLRNFNKERFGLFRMPGMFMRQTYLQPPTGAAGEKAMETGAFRLDVSGLAQCYDTASGVGILNRSGVADQKARQKGIPFWGLMLAVIVLGAAATKLPWVFAHGIKGIVSPSVGGVKVSTNTPVPAAQAALPAPMLHSVTSEPVPQFAQMPTLPPTALPDEVHDKLFVTGTWRELGTGLWQVFLSDGRRLTERKDSEFEGLTRGGAKISGRFVPWAKPTGGVSAANEKNLNFGGVSQNRTLSQGSYIITPGVRYRQKQPLPGASVMPSQNKK